MAEQIESLLKGVVLKQKGKTVERPERDNYAVHPVKGGPVEAMPGTAVVDALKKAFPRCVFTFCAKALAKAGESKGGAKGDGKGGESK